MRTDHGPIIGYLLIATDNTARKLAEEALLNAGALQRAIFNSANFWSIATDAKGVIQIFNVGAECMLGYSAAEVMNKITPADISDPNEVVARAEALSLELGTPITPGFEALIFKAARGIEDIYELTYIRKDGSRFPAVVSVTALRDAQETIIGYLLIGTDSPLRKDAEDKRLWARKLSADGRERHGLRHHHVRHSSSRSFAPSGSSTNSLTTPAPGLKKSSSPPTANSIWPNSRPTSKPPSPSAAATVLTTAASSSLRFCSATFSAWTRTPARLKSPRPTFGRKPSNSRRPTTTIAS